MILLKIKNKKLAVLHEKSSRLTIKNNYNLLCGSIIILSIYLL